MNSPSPKAGLSFWLDEALASEDPVSPSRLDRDSRADVCIIGGGFTGLWSAIELKRARPDLDVVIVERDHCGSGASGRNGGFVLSLWAKYTTLAALCGEAEALRLCQASEEAILGLDDFCRAEGIDAELRLDGWLWAATSRAQAGTWDETLAALNAQGRHPFRILTAGETAQLAGSRAHLAGVYERVSASVQPARLARGLMRHARRLGVRIHEQSPMIRLERGAEARVVCEGGSIRAPRVILAMNAWASAFAEIRKAIVVVSSDIVVTRPLPELLAAIGWNSGLTISDCRMLVHYYRTTPAGRIVFGKGGGSGLMAYGAQVGDRFDGPSPISAEVGDWLVRLYPQVTPRDLVQSWMGPIDRSRNGLPMFGPLPDQPNVFYAVGYSGNGVGPTMLGGKILAALALALDNEWARCGLVQPLQRAFPPEPLRHLGGRVVRYAIASNDQAADEGRQSNRLLRALASLAPAGLSPIKSGVGVSTGAD